MNPAVSVVIPSHNRPHTLKRALNSVLRQSLSDFECLIVDDSVDTQAIRDVVAECDDARIRLFQFPLMSAIEAWRKCLSLASGRYIQFLLDDDWLDPMILQLAAAALDEDAGVNLVFWGAVARLADTDWIGYFSRRMCRVSPQEFECRCLSPANGDIPNNPSAVMVRAFNGIRLFSDFENPEVRDLAQKTYACDLLYVMEAGLSGTAVLQLPRIGSFFGTDAESLTMQDVGLVNYIQGLFKEEYLRRPNWRRDCSAK